MVCTNCQREITTDDFITNRDGSHSHMTEQHCLIAALDVIRSLLKLVEELAGRDSDRATRTGKSGENAA